jgi:hypothetical protein
MRYASVSLSLSVHLCVCVLLRRAGAGRCAAYDVYAFGDQLTTAQKQKFVTDGFIHMRHIVKTSLVEAALRDVHRSLGAGYTREQRAHFERLTWCPDLQQASAMLDLLFCTPALALAMSLVGPVARVQSAVIQVRVRECDSSRTR